ncbi:hypothetical protein tb265_48010 [Gemmatimonadetes bacterium T265]|nr:hypothetical protein tb265_48010 [Gemmatimonadetes bacterium T265]
MVVAAVCALLGRTRERVPRAWIPVLTWGGLRGGLSMVLALTLPADFPQRGLLVTMTFGVVVLSILGQGLTIGPLLRRLGVVGHHSPRTDYARARAALVLAESALGEIERMTRSRRVPADVAADLRATYEARAHAAESAADALRLERGELREVEAQRAARHLLLVEKDRLIAARRTGEVSDEVYHALAADADARLVALDAAGDAP